MTLRVFRKVRRSLLCLALAIIAMPASAQSLRGHCGDLDPDISIGGCTREIQSYTADMNTSGGNLKAAAAHLATAYDIRGIAYASKRLYDEAIADYNQAISVSPQAYPIAYFNRAGAYGDQGLDDQAIADYSKAIALQPAGVNPDFSLAEAYAFRGNAYENKGQTDQAIADYTMAISIDPRMERAYQNRGNGYLRKGQYDLAIADFTQVISFDRRNITSLFNRALAYQHKGLFDLAIADLTAEISFAPNDAGAYDVRGLTYVQMGRHDEAIADFTQEIALNAKDMALHPAFSSRYALSYVHRAQAHERKGAMEAAAADYRAAIKLDPAMQAAKDGVRRLGAEP